MFKKTMVIALEENMLKTSLYKEELPKVDGMFKYQNLKIFMCFRKGFAELIEHCSKLFEIIVWTSSNRDYSNALVD
jgi:TFIIF-interacting CTD phosphatase-like protein